MITRLEDLVVPDDMEKLDLRLCTRRQAVTWLTDLSPTEWAYASTRIRQARASAPDLDHFDWAIHGAVTDILRTYLDYGDRKMSSQDKEFIENLCALVLEFRIEGAVSAVYGLSRSGIADLVLMRVGDSRAFWERWRAYWDGDNPALWMCGWEGIMRAEPRAIFKELGRALLRSHTNNFQIDDALDLLRRTLPEPLVAEERVRVLKKDPMSDDARAFAMLEAA